MNATATPIFMKTLTLIFDNDLTEDFDLGTKERVLSQGIYMYNIKTLSLTIQTDGPKTICPDLSMCGHKNSATSVPMLVFNGNN